MVPKDDWRRTWLDDIPKGADFHEERGWTLEGDDDNVWEIDGVLSW